MSTRLAQLKPGDKVMVSLYGRPAQPATVEKVGRKLITAARCQFRIENGGLNSGYAGRILTMDEYAEQAEREQLGEELRKRGVDLNHRARLTTDTLRSLVAVLRDAAEA